VRSPSARNRIVAWLVLLVLIALVVNQLVATRVLLTRVEADTATEIEHEYGKFRAFTERHVESSAAAITDVSQLLDAYLVSNVPERSETFFSVVDGRAQSRSSPEPLARLDKDPEFVEMVARAREPLHGRWESTAGEVRFGAFPIHIEDDERWGQLVVVEFMAPARDAALATLRTIAAISLAGLAIGAVAAWLVAGRILRPVRLVRDTAERISESDLTQRIDVSGDDEVAQLARTFNRMLDRIESAFTDQRRFLDDAGHELRTPLTIVRGHLEVMGPSEEDRAATLALVNDELARMSRIVDDLLLLARAQRPDFISPHAVDLADLVVEVVAKSQALGQRRWLVDELAEATVTADGQRLTQALMQLTANAVEHTDTGDRISVGSAVHDDRVLLWVDDDGSGIPQADQERIFERFATSHRRRTAATRSDSTGLGLAIVRSIAEGHGGTVRLHSIPGEGSRFTLDIPLRTEPRTDPDDAETREPPSPDQEQREQRERSRSSL